MANYVNTVTGAVPQGMKAKSGQAKNRAGGFVFEVDDWTRFNRFLILGNEGGSYYASEKTLTFENYDVVQRCLNSDYKRTIDEIVEISDAGRAIKNDPAIFALAVCCVFGTQESRTYANFVVSKVARYSTNFFEYVDAVKKLKEDRFAGGLKKVIGRWYNQKDAKGVAYQVCKYPSRSIGSQRWSHADMLRLGHVVPSTPEHQIAFRYASHGIGAADRRTDDKIAKRDGLTVDQLNSLKGTDLQYIWAHEMAKVATKTSEIVNLVTDYNITRESIPPHFRNEVEVQEALLTEMPMTALIRNLGQMTSTGLLKPLSDATKLAISKIKNEEAIKKSRIHPMTIMLALKTYHSGKGMRTTWNHVSQIADAMESAFYMAFNYVEPTNKNYLIGVDVSGSMDGFGCGSKKNFMTAREAAAVVGMTIARSEENYEFMGFSDKFVNLGITAKDSLSTVVEKISGLPFSRTDCSLPMQYASKNKIDNVDVFVVLTDSETWFGKIHPFQALKDYRKNFNPNAKLAVLAFEADKFSIADPSDAGMMDIAGLDASVPKILAEFALGNI